MQFRCFCVVVFFNKQILQVVLPNFDLISLACVFDLELFQVPFEVLLRGVNLAILSIVVSQVAQVAVLSKDGPDVLNHVVIELFDSFS